MISFTPHHPLRYNYYYPFHSTDGETLVLEQGSPGAESGFESRQFDSRALVLNHSPAPDSQSQHLTKIYSKRPNLNCVYFLQFSSHHLLFEFPNLFLALSPVSTLQPEWLCKNGNWIAVFLLKIFLCVLLALGCKSKIYAWCVRHGICPLPRSVTLFPVITLSCL